MGKAALCVCAAMMIASAVPARAHADDPSPTEVAATTREPARSPRHAIFLELLGKGGLWGLGYTHQLHPRLAVGGVASFTLLDGQRIYAVSPSLTAYLVGTHRHRWFVDAGPQFVRISTPSPVPEWSGTSSNGVGGQVATGYEHRSHVLVRAFAMAAFGKGGIAPWLGADVGWAF